MALPTLQTSKYKTTIPSTGKSIEFRPFLVKEEKILMIAQESEDTSMILNAMKDIVKNCTFEKVDVDELASYDLEYLFLQLRAKSVGEIIDLQVKCDKCGELNQLQVNLEEVEIKKPTKEVDNKVILENNIGITLKPISVKDVDGISDKVEDFTKTLSLCIDTIFDDNNVYNVKDVSPSELETFVESMSHKHLLMIDEFMKNQPSIIYNGEYTCHSCKKKNTFTLEGLQDFFA